MLAGTITELRVRGLRTLADVKLRIDGLTVLIGENGSGKSSLLEACEILRLAMDHSIVDRIQRFHGGLQSLLRSGASELAIGVTCKKTGATATYSYDLVFRRNSDVSSGVELGEELVVNHKDGSRTNVISRVGRTAQVTSLMQPDLKTINSMDERTTLVSSWGRLFGELWTKELVDIVSSIDVHVPFDIWPRWTSPDSTQSSGPRASNVVQPTAALERGAKNLANAYYELRNRRDWPETLDYIKLGLGPHVVDVTTQADPAGGVIGLLIEDDRLASKLPASCISDGMLAYLAFVALFRLNKDKSLIAFDEPEVHLHPELLRRVVSMFETLGAGTSVLLSTHSDQLLDSLEHPERSVVTCSIDDEAKTTLSRTDAATLKKWLSEYSYRGLGHIREEGHLESVLLREK
jgi:predicted ATPase